MTPIEILRWQLRLSWSLAELRLTGLTDAACLWEPAPGAWTVRRGEDGRWRPDWVEPEPDPPLTATLGWLTWHLSWWWSELLAHATGAPVPAREDVEWPGCADAVVAGLIGLHGGWAAVLETADLDRPVAFPWPEPRPMVNAAAWANQELMKNVAEIGQLRDLHEVLSRSGDQRHRPR